MDINYIKFLLSKGVKNMTLTEIYEAYKVKKLAFEQAKKEKEARKNQHVVDIKEVRLGLNTDVGDFNTKLRNAQKFLSEGNRVKVTVRFRGREMAHTNLGEKLLMDFAEACAETANMEKNPKLEGRFMGMFLAPKNSK